MTLQSLTNITNIVTALLDNIIMPIVGAVLGGIDFSGLAINVGDAAFSLSLIGFVEFAPD